MSSTKFIKLALCGDGAVGKTSLRQRFLGRGFTASHLMTIGADFCNLEMNIEGENTLFQVYDLAGQPNFSAIRSRFYQGCQGGILVCDLTREQTFLNLSSWIKELWKHNGKGAIPFIILGNKADLKGEVKEGRIKKYAIW